MQKVIPHPVQEPWIPRLYPPTPCWVRLDLFCDEVKMLSNLKDFAPVPHRGVVWRVCCFRYLQGFNGYDAGDVQEIL